MKNKAINGLLVAGLLLATTTACKDYLDYQPKGALSTENVTTASNAEALVTAAYAGIGNDDMIGPMTSMWVYGSVRSDDSYKGGGGVSDISDVNFYEQYNLTQPQQGEGWMHPFTWENLPGDFAGQFRPENHQCPFGSGLSVAENPAGRAALPQGPLVFHAQNAL